MTQQANALPFDPAEFGDAIIDAVKSYVSMKLDPIAKSVSELSSQVAEVKSAPPAKDGVSPELPDIEGMVKQFVDAAVAPVSSELQEIKGEVGTVIQKSSDFVGQKAISDAIAAHQEAFATKDDETTVARIAALEDAVSRTVENAQEAITKALSEIPTPKDGADAVLPDIQAIVADAISPLMEKTATELEALAREEIARAVAEIPAPRDGADAVLPDIAAMVADAVAPVIAKAEEAIAAIVTPKDGVDGASVTVNDVLPMLKAHVDDVLSSIAIPTPKDGEAGLGIADAQIIDGELRFTMTDGTVKSLGQVVGKSEVIEAPTIDYMAMEVPEEIAIMTAKALRMCAELPLNEMVNRPAKSGKKQAPVFNITLEQPKTASKTKTTVTEWTDDGLAKSMIKEDIFDGEDA